jgi:hypothetical protein
VTHAYIYDVSDWLASVGGVPHDTYPGSSETDPCLAFRTEDGDSYMLRHDTRHGWVLDAQDELSEGVGGTIQTVRLPCVDRAPALLVAAAVEGIYRGLIDELESVR